MTAATMGWTVLALMSGAAVAQSQSQPPRIITHLGDIEFVTNAGREVTLIRDGDELGLWGLADQVNSLETSVSTSLVTTISQLRAELTVATEQVNASLGQQVAGIGTALSQVRTELGAAVNDLNSSMAARFEGVSQSLLGLTRQLSSVASVVELQANCSARGMFVDSSGACQAPRPRNAASSVECTNTTLGQLRFNVTASLLEVCALVGPNSTAIYSAVYEPPPIGSEQNPARSGGHLIQSRPNAPSGMYWLKPPGDNVAARTYCDMSTYGGGYCLANVGYVCSTGAADCNRGLINMNRPNGYNWDPQDRSSSHMLIDLSSGALNLAKASTQMMMAAGNNPSNGGLSPYSYHYEINMSEASRRHLDFGNGNRFHRACQATANGARMAIVPFTVQGRKGDIGVWRNKLSTREALMISWGDSFPSGYGFSSTRRGCTNSWNDGPFFPSVHSGDGHGGGCNTYSGWGRFNSPPDVQCGKFEYTHRGWYRVHNGRYNNRGQTSIWFR